MNFVVFVVDQLCASHLGCYGNPNIQTPNIDSLAELGWRAEECFVATPICMPNRASLLTGRMPSAHGVRHNGIPLSLSSITMVDALRDAGYSTSLIGKSHLQNITTRAPLAAAGVKRLPRDAQRPYPGNYMQENAATWHDDPEAEVDLPFYGFDHVELAIEHGDAAGGHYQRWLRGQHPAVAASIGRQQAWPSDDFELSKVGQAWRTRVPEELHPTAWIADRSIERIRRAHSAQQPFFVYCSFPDPHHPYTPPGRYWDMYRPEEMALPASFRSDTPPPHLAWLRQQRDAGLAVKNSQACFAATEREVREAMALSFGSLSFIDAQVGKVLRVLDDLDLAKDTVVVFTSDHGEFAGDHQLLLKGSLHYRSVIRTALVWRDPAHQAAAGRCDASLLSTIDIAPTILERAGVEGYNGIQGRSFLGAIAGDGAPPREAVVIEEEGQRTYFGFERPVRMRSLVTEAFRLSVYDGVDWGELYDRRRDPLEETNLWNDEAYREQRVALCARLALEMMALTDTSPAPTALA